MSILERVGKVFENVFDFEASNISASTVPDDVPKWDSIGHMSMVSELETEFSVQFELDEVMEMADVGKILEILTNKGIKDL